MTTIKINKDKLELKKHIATIHSHGKITLLQRKIANALLFHAYHNLMTQEEHIIQISELTKLVGFDSNDHKKIKDALVKLISTVIEWNVIDELSEENEEWNASSIISDVSIKGSICRYSYSNRMRKLLYHPIRYGKIDLAIQTKFQSSYGLTLYENCNRYRAIGITPWFDLETFKKLMGVEQGLYKVFRDLNNRVIKKSVEEVNEHTSMLVEPELKKINRQVIAIRFFIKQKKASYAIIKQEKNAELIEQLKNQFGLSIKQVNEILKDYEELYIKNKIELILKSDPYRCGLIRNLAKYLIAALKEDYQIPIASKNIITLQIKNKNFSAEEERDYLKYKHQYIDEVFDKADQTYKNNVLQQFKEKIKKSTYLGLYEKHGLENVLVKDQFYIFFIKKMEKENIQIPSIESYIQEKNKQKEFFR